MSFGDFVENNIMNSRSIFTIFVILLLSGCSMFGTNQDDKKLVADGLTPKKLYEKAEDKVKSGLIEQAIDDYQLILDSYPNSKYAIQARLDIAYNLYKQKKHNRAIIELDNFIEKYPNIEPTPYAYYLKGIIAESKSNSILDNIVTDNAQRDVGSVKDAYKYFQELIYSFPDSKYADEAKNNLSNLRNILARHEFYVAMYYHRVGAHIASSNRLKYIIENYPTSVSIPDALYLMARDYEIMGANKLASDTKEILFSSYPDYIPNYSLE